MPTTDANNLPDMRADFDVETPMRDGTILRCDIYRPARLERVPVLLCRTPYDKRAGTRIATGIDLRGAISRGYALVFQDVRGRFASEGEYKPVATQEIEGRDGYDTIEWLARRPWCSGAVAMFGLSYCSLVTLMAACENPPSLKAIIPEKTGDPARGALILDGTLITWAALQAMDWVQKAMARGEAGPNEAAIIQQTLADPQSAARHLPLDDLPLLKIGGLPKLQELVSLLQSTTGIDVASIRAPALVVSGWYDIGTVETGQMYEKLLHREGNVETGIIFGPWNHPTMSYIAGDMHFGFFALSDFAGVPDTYFNFLDRYLKGDTAKPSAGARYFVMGANEWRTAKTWPPANRPKPFFLHSDGSANGVEGNGRLDAGAPPPAMKPDRYRYDPLYPVPSIGGRYFDVGGSIAGPRDQARVERRRDVLVYTGDALAADLEIAGGVKLRLFMACDAPDTDLAAKLCDVHPDGMSYNIADEFFRCRWRNGYDRTELFELGEIYEFTIDLGPVAHRFKRGHRIRLQVTSSAFPQFDRNMNTGHPIGVDKEGPVAEITIFHDADRPSSLTLPIVESA